MWKCFLNFTFFFRAIYAICTIQSCFQSAQFSFTTACQLPTVCVTFESSFKKITSNKSPILRKCEAKMLKCSKFTNFLHHDFELFALVSVFVLKLLLLNRPFFDIDDRSINRIKVYFLLILILVSFLIIQPRIPYHFVKCQTNHKVPVRIVSNVYSWSTAVFIFVSLMKC